MNVSNIVAIALALAALNIRAAGQSYQTVVVDGDGQLSITLASGLVAHPPKLQDQVAFSQPLISGDHRTLAWLADYADPSAPQGSSDLIAERLVLYRAGHVIRSFGTDQIFWSWQFVREDRDVAFCTGPTHGGVSVCELHRIDSGRLLAKWDAHGTDVSPLWVKGINH